jgi:hypothetical protein
VRAFLTFGPLMSAVGTQWLVTLFDTVSFDGGSPDGSGRKEMVLADHAVDARRSLPWRYVGMLEGSSNFGSDRESFGSRPPGASPSNCGDRGTMGFGQVVTESRFEYRCHGVNLPSRHGRVAESSVQRLGRTPGLVALRSHGTFPYNLGFGGGTVPFPKAPARPIAETFRERRYD